MVRAAKKATEAPAPKAKLAKKATASSKLAAKVQSDGEAVPSKKAKPDKEVAAGRKRKAAASADTGLTTVSHGSHGKVSSAQRMHHVNIAAASQQHEANAMKV
jgi:hypothetical protein